MRILFTVIPEKTTFLHTVPLAWALRTAGHDVRVASAPGFTDTITQAGLTAVPVGRDAPLWRVDGINPELVEQSRAGLPLPWSVVTDPGNAVWEYLLEGFTIAVDEGHKPENFPIVAGLVNFARHWQPDLVIWEPLSYAGAIAAKACGAAHARMLWSIDVFAVTRDHFLRMLKQQPAEQQADPLADWLGSYGRKYGYEFTEDMTSGHFTIDQMPASLGMRSETVHYLPLQYIPYGGPAVIPKWLHAVPKRPRVALTLGTTATDRFAGYSFSVQDAFDALSELDIEVVATIAESEQHKLSRVPDNTRVVNYVPLDALAATCSVMINHTGPGTYLTTACNGVPQLNLPWNFDEPELAQRSARHGASLMLHGEEVTGKNIREYLLRLLDEPAFGRQAGVLRDEITTMPSPNELVADLEELTVKHRTRVS
ncbi:glycosyltransferase (activator-dependent family) [Kibdelosporangium banguiense]|uniref:Glycosyltransferase (Activator-dependent family) n=1 Tax=Kibdelosporangium banguiense TaxID=1365924 RepID=A0ABS4TXG0_9PSEU|nr:activator-dependent family glycosyltransferase [Kibdelosporangium banguiense]MBP2329080.1 glycosyltransferase (activator-dependent family) [Kibdelosporangium banguiense]